MADRFPLILNTSTNQIQEIPSGDSLDLTGSGIANAGIITAGNVTIGAATTDLIVNGDARVTGILTVGTGSLTLDGPNNLVNVGTALTLGHTQGLQFHTQNLHSAGFEVNQINVSGASTMGDDVTFNGASSKNMVWDSSDGDLEFADNARLKFGNDDDFFLYHNGSHSYIKNSTNYLYYLATQHHFKNAANNELQARFQENGPVELYHDNTKRFETTTSGVTITGDGTFTGNVSIGGTLTYEDVTNIDSVGIITARSGINLIGGNITLGDTSDGSSDDLLIFGAGSDLKIYHDSNHSYIQNATGDLFIKSNADDLVLQAADDVLIRPQNGEDGIKVIGNGAVELYHDNSKKFETFSGGISVTGQVNSDGSHMGDNDKALFGDSNDLQIFHSGTHSFIENSTGILAIRSDSFQITDKSNNHAMITAAQDGAVELYYDNSKKLETTSAGATVTGDLTVGTAQILSNGNILLADNDKIKIGTGEDLQIFHDGTTNKITLGGLELQILGGGSNNKKIFVANTSNAAELYFDNSKKFETTTNGVHLSGGTNTVNGNFYPINDTVGQLGLSNRRWETINGVTLNINGGDAEFRGTTPGTTDMTWDQSDNSLKFDDSVKAKFGNSGDLEIYHDGTNSTIQNNTGVFYLKTVNGEFSLVARPNGATELYHDHSKKFSTISGGAYITGSLGVGAATNPTHHYNQGIHVHAAGTGAVLHLTDSTSGSGASDGFDVLSHQGTAYLWQRENANMIFGTNSNSRWLIYGSNGHFVPDANNTYDIGTSSNRVRNIYTNDLNLSNEGGANDVDNTWGDYTIQEGESDLFLINNRSGKKYKFNLTEVS